jgi:ubiquinone/menaquinone biosynthesis C-methylase UbiE
VSVDGKVEFDEIAPVYDETRRPPSGAEVRALVQLLSGCRTVLDAGVGTGRFAAPLQTERFEVVGVDLSRGMMKRAQAKGIRSLVRADLRHLPFSSRSVDAAFTAHVLQLIPEPREVLSELGRVARRTVVVLLPDWSGREPPGGWHSIRERYRELAAELGYPLPARGKRYRHTLEDLSAIATPRLVRRVEGSAASPHTIGVWLARWEARATCGTPVPPEVHAEIVHRLEAEYPRESSRARHGRVEQLIAWDPSDLAGQS